MNIRSIYLAGLFAIIGSHIINTNAQQLRNPFDFPILLSGNFGELRSNHFHSGIDFKTQGVLQRLLQPCQGECHIGRRPHARRNCDLPDLFFMRLPLKE